MYNRCAVFDYNKKRDVLDPQGLSEKVFGIPRLSYLSGFYYCYYYYYYGTYIFLGNRLLDTQPAYWSRSTITEKRSHAFLVIYGVQYRSYTLLLVDRSSTHPKHSVDRNDRPLLVLPSSDRWCSSTVFNQNVYLCIYYILKVSG